MPTFPLPFIPAQDYHTGGVSFGAGRDGRKHAACDLVAPKGTEILAVLPGTVTGGPYHFYHGTYALEVDHGLYVARYGEISGAAAGISTGTAVEEGQVIAYVGQMHVDSMLHFELYDGTASGPLSGGTGPFKRRKDLIDPTPFLDECVREFYARQNYEARISLERQMKEDHLADLEPRGRGVLH